MAAMSLRPACKVKGKARAAARPLRLCSLRQTIHQDSSVAAPLEKHPVPLPLSAFTLEFPRAQRPPHRNAECRIRSVEWGKRDRGQGKCRIQNSERGMRKRETLK